MKRIKFIIILGCLNFVFYGCGTLNEAGKVLRNEKIKTTDEFLVKKKEPLSQPPDFNTIPEPGSLDKKENKESIEKILSLPKSNSNKTRNKGSGVEDSILEILR
tara:strand:- start:7 stop:318 length:312 start_codon:yes stop_codon:yes gene_type:complete